MILFVGIATNKLMRADLAADDQAQPWLMDVAAELGDGVIPAALFKRAVRLPKNVAVQEGAEGVHGISTRAGRRFGATQRWVAYGLLELVNEASTIVTYGDMMKKVLTSVIMREAGKDADRWIGQLNRTGIEWIDLRTPCTEICKLKYEKAETAGYRWPSRKEAADKILDSGTMAGLCHDELWGAAWHNMKTEMALFYELCQRKIIEWGANGKS